MEQSSAENCLISDMASHFHPSRTHRLIVSTRHSQYSRAGLKVCCRISRLSRMIFEHFDLGFTGNARKVQFKSMFYRCLYYNSHIKMGSASLIWKKVSVYCRLMEIVVAWREKKLRFLVEQCMFNYQISEQIVFWEARIML